MFRLFPFFFMLSISISAQNVGVNIGVPEFTLDARSLDVSSSSNLHLSTPLKENFLRLFSGNSLSPNAVIARSLNDDLSFGTYSPSLKIQMTLSKFGNLNLGIGETGDRLSILGPAGDGVNASLRIANPNPPFADDYLLMDANQIDAYSFKGLEVQGLSSGNLELVNGGGGVGINTAAINWIKLHVEGADVDYQAPTQAPAAMVISSDGPNFNWMMLDGNDILTLDYPLIINGNGIQPVTIGTTVPATGYKLSVAGKVMAEEVRVQLSGSWPDYVFEDDYRLLTFEDLESFIRSKGHLPGIPNAESIHTSGIALGEMQRVMMEKIEEAFLYILQLENSIKEMQKENEILKTKLRR